MQKQNWAYSVAENFYRKIWDFRGHLRSHEQGISTLISKRHKTGKQGVIDTATFSDLCFRFVFSLSKTVFVFVRNFWYQNVLPKKFLNKYQNNCDSNFFSYFEKHLDPVLTWCWQSLWTKPKTWEYSEAIVNYPRNIYIATRTIQKDTWNW